MIPLQFLSHVAILNIRRTRTELGSNLLMPGKRKRKRITVNELWEIPEPLKLSVAFDDCPVILVSCVIKNVK